jgi:hypothetical protein
MFQNSPFATSIARRSSVLVREQKTLLREMLIEGKGQLRTSLTHH